MLTWAIQGVQPKPTKFSRIRHALTCFINVFLPVGKTISWVSLCIMGPSCIGTFIYFLPVITTLISWLILSWKVPCLILSTHILLSKNTGCSFLLPSQSILFCSCLSLFDGFQDPLFGCILWKNTSGPSLTSHVDWSWCPLYLYLLGFIFPSQNLVNHSELFSIISSKQSPISYCCHWLNI